MTVSGYAEKNRRWLGLGLVALHILLGLGLVVLADAIVLNLNIDTV